MNLFFYFLGCYNLCCLFVCVVVGFLRGDESCMLYLGGLEMILF